MKFTYVLAGWEGSANDAHILRMALERDPRFPRPPPNKYYLVDAGYANAPQFLAPYRGHRCHLEQFEGGARHYSGPHELFNHRHSRLRNVVERCFGLLKQRFPILHYGMPRYKLKHQVQIVLACCALHNYIRMSDDDEGLFNNEEDNSADAETTNFAPYEPPDVDQSQFRDFLAANLWQNYPH